MPRGGVPSHGMLAVSPQGLHAPHLAGLAVDFRQLGLGPRHPFRDLLTQGGSMISFGGLVCLRRPIVVVAVHCGQFVNRKVSRVMGACCLTPTIMAP